jgi:D-inositol-3-phosphate glycosyltransferase
LNGESILLFVGRIIPLKGIDNILKAMAHLERKQRIKLVVIGGDDQSRAEIQRLKNLSRTLSIDEGVLFQGSVKQEALPLFYSAANVCVLPSYYESFGLVVLESLACGTPVVATRVGCAEGVIRYGETGYVMTENDPGSLAEKISRLLFTPNGNPDFIRSVRASVAKYSWANISEAILEEYRSVLWDFSTRACKEAEEGRV